METPTSSSSTRRFLSSAMKEETILFLAQCFALPVAQGLVEYKRRENHWPEGKKGWFRLALIGLFLWIFEAAAVSKNEERKEQERKEQERNEQKYEQERYEDEKVNHYRGNSP